VEGEGGLEVPENHPNVVLPQMQKIEEPKGCGRGEANRDRRPGAEEAPHHQWEEHCHSPQGVPTVAQKRQAKE
jgi:hypothetical protein